LSHIGRQRLLLAVNDCVDKGIRDGIGRSVGDDTSVNVDDQKAVGCEERRTDYHQAN
jgi:hypothetical protein